MSVIVRPATQGDFDSIQSLWTKCGVELGPWNPGEIRAQIESGRLHVAVVGTRVLGFVSFRERRDGVRTIYAIGASQKCMGIGTALIESLGPGAIRLKCKADNHGANLFYRRAGFACEGVERSRTGSGLLIWVRG